MMSDPDNTGGAAPETPEGQELAKKRNYAPLPADLQKKMTPVVATE